MSAEVQREADGAAGERRVELRRALRAAEEECLRLRTGLLTLVGARLPGVHLVARVAGAAVLLPGDRIAEIALVVACTPLPGAPAWVRGGFLWRGRPAVAVDLGVRLGLARTASLEALLVILDGDPTVALVVDGVASLAEDPVVSEGDGGAGVPDGPLLGVCELEGRPVPLLLPEALEGELRRLT